MGRTSNGSIAGQWASSTSNNQQWTKETAGNYVKFKNRATGLYLDGLGQTTSGADLGQWSTSSSNNQQWSAVTLTSARSASKVSSNQATPEEQGYQVTLYPNPSTSTFNLSIGKSEKVTLVEIFDLSGKSVGTIRPSSNSNRLEFGATLPPNMYIIKVSGLGWERSFKVVKK
jgi:hypothetical protein